MIDSFRGKYAFLSNFSDSKIEINGITFRNSEAAFQSFKDPSRQSEFSSLSGIEAKRKGKQVHIRSDWDDVKDEVMYCVLWVKFDQNEDLKRMLLITGDELLVEGNNWGDEYWGVCKGVGQNNLGKILMRLRNEFMEEDK